MINPHSVLIVCAILCEVLAVALENKMALVAIGLALFFLSTIVR